MALDSKRNYSGGNFFVDVAGEIMGNIKKAGGFNQKAEVVEEKVATIKNPQFTIGNITYDPISVDFGASVSKGMLDWINLSFQGEHARRDGAVIAADADGFERSRLDYFQALITEVGFPAADAAAKEPGYVTCKWQPEYTRFAKGSGSKIPTGKVETRQKVFVPNNFKFEMGNMPCALVSKVDAITWKQKVTQDPVGDRRDYEYVPSAMEVTKLKITLGARDFDAWHDWFKDFVIDGNCGADKEVNGSLVYLSQNRQQELMRVNFHQCGIFSISRSDLEANADKLNTVTVEVYAERMDFVVG